MAHPMTDADLLRRELLKTKAMETPMPPVTMAQAFANIPAPEPEPVVEPEPEPTPDPPGTPQDAAQSQYHALEAFPDPAPAPEPEGQKLGTATEAADTGAELQRFTEPPPPAPVEAEQTPEPKSYDNRGDRMAQVLNAMNANKALPDTFFTSEQDQANKLALLQQKKAAAGKEQKDKTVLAEALRRSAPVLARELGDDVINGMSSVELRAMFSRDMQTKRFGESQGMNTWRRGEHDEDQARFASNDEFRHTDSDRRYTELQKQHEQMKKEHEGKALTMYSAAIKDQIPIISDLNEIEKLSGGLAHGFVSPDATVMNTEWEKVKQRAPFMMGTRFQRADVAKLQAAIAKLNQDYARPQVGATYTPEEYARMQKIVMDAVAAPPEIQAAAIDLIRNSTASVIKEKRAAFNVMIGPDTWGVYKAGGGATPEDPIFQPYTPGPEQAAANPYVAPPQKPGQPAPVKPKPQEPGMIESAAKKIFETIMPDATASQKPKEEIFDAPQGPAPKGMAWAKNKAGKYKLVPDPRGG